MVTPAAKREAVAHLRSAFDMSERRACRTIGCVRMTVRYRCRRPDDAELRERLRSLARARRRFGYRRLRVLLRREGFTVNHKRLFRLYRQTILLQRECELGASVYSFVLFYNAVLEAQTLGDGRRQTARFKTTEGRPGAQDRCDPASHVGRWLNLPVD
jgi:putative transposase